MSLNVLVLETYADVYARELRRRFPDLSVCPAKTRADPAIDLKTVDVLVAFGVSIDDDLIRPATRLKWIQCLATGVDQILRCPSLRPDVLVTSGRGIHGPAMRETAAFLMLALSHDARRLAGNQAEHRWEREKPWPLLSGKTAVLVGVGISGTAVAGLLGAFGMRVIGVSRTPRRVEGLDEVVHTDRLGEIVRDADFVVNILPGGPQNAGLIGRTVFEAMKPTAFFVNIGRGETVDEDALVDALRSRRIAGAGLDVFRTEPLPAESPLWDLPNVVVSPHIAGLFDEYENYVMPILIENMRLYLDGRLAGMRNLVPH